MGLSTTCHTRGKMDDEFFREQAEYVLDKLEGGADLEVWIVGVDDTAECRDVAADLPIDDAEVFIAQCQQAKTSLSVRISGQEFIIIKTDKPFVQTNAAALRGLIAHELMHTVQRVRGIEQDIEDAAASYEERAIDQLLALGMDKNQVSRFIHTVYSTAIFALKDLYDNTELIRQGFAPELEEYYYHMLDIDGYCPMPDFYGAEAELDEIEDAITFELGLLPAWLPFEALNHATAEDIRHRIKECYEQDIPQVAYYVHKIRDLYHDKYDNPDEFKNLFYQQIFDAAHDVIKKKLGETAT